MKKEIMKARAEFSRVDFKKIFVFASLLILGINILIGAALNPLETYLASRNAIFTEAVFYLIKLLSMISFFAALGAAYFLASFKGSFSDGVKIILIASASSILSLMIATLIQNIDIVDGTFWTKMFSSVMLALLNFVISFALLFAGYLFPYRVFIKKIDVFDFKLYNKKLWICAIFASAISAVYNLGVLTIETVADIIAYAPLYTNEIMSIIYDYFFIIVTSVVGAFIIVLSCRLYASEHFRLKK